MWSYGSCGQQGLRVDIPNPRTGTLRGRRGAGLRTRRGRAPARTQAALGQVQGRTGEGRQESAYWRRF